MFYQMMEQPQTSQTCQAEHWWCLPAMYINTLYLRVALFYLVFIMLFNSAAAQLGGGGGLLTPSPNPSNGASVSTVDAPPTLDVTDQGEDTTFSDGYTGTLYFYTGSASLIGTCNMQLHDGQYPSAVPSSCGGRTGDGPTYSSADTEDTYSWYVETEGGSTSTTWSFTVGNPNEPPTADINAPSSLDVSEGATFDGSGSSDPEGDSLRYSWDFGNGDTSTQASPYHQYHSPGSYTVTLTVSDGNGNSDTVNHNVDVSDTSSPSINPSPTGTVSTTSPTISANFDDNHQLSSYTLELDGTQVDSGSISGGSDSASYSASGLSEGDHTYTWTATDSAGNTNTNQATFTVNTNSPPTADLTGPSSLSLNQQGSFDASGSSDPDGDSLSYSWSVDSGSISGSSGIESWGSPGSYTVSVTVSDGNGGSDTASVNVDVSDESNPFVSSPSPTGTVGTSSPSISTDFTDNYDLSSYTLDLNGNQVASGGLSGTSGSQSYSASGLSDGSHTYTWTVTDSAGNSDSRQETFTVSTSILQSTSNSNTVKGTIWVQSSDLHWGDGSTEYWLKDANIVTSSASGPNGALWIQGSSIRWIDQNGNKRSYTGPEVATNVGGPYGALWMQNGYLHYIDSDGDKRIMDGT